MITFTLKFQEMPDGGISRELVLDDTDATGPEKTMIVNWGTDQFKTPLELLKESLESYAHNVVLQSPPQKPHRQL